jgi:hypothetical protein
MVDLWTEFFELRHNKFAKCLVIIQFGIAIIIWMDAPNIRLIGRLPRILLPTVAAESHLTSGPFDVLQEPFFQDYTTRKELLTS